MLSRKLFTAVVVGSTFLLALAAGNGFCEEKAGMAALTDAAKSATESVDKGSLGDMIDINTVDTETLAAVPVIGPQLAEAITTYRDAHGSFTEAKDLLNVEGIDASLLEKIKPLLKF